MKNITARFLLFFICIFSIVEIEAKNMPSNPISPENRDSISYIVYFEGDVDEALHSDNAYIKTFIEVYQLELHKTFEYEHNIKGFVLFAPKNQYIATELAKELSLIEDVFMVELQKIENTKLAI
jgi:hypothetical protein